MPDTPRSRFEPSAAAAPRTEALFDAYATPLYKYIASRVGDPATAEELLQETFLNCLAPKTALNWRDPWRTLTLLAHSHIINHYRKHNRALPATHHTQWLRAFDTADTATAATLLQSEENRALIRQVLSALPPDYQTVLELFYIEDRPVKQIAAQMQRTEKSIDGLLQRARDAFFEHGKKYFGDSHDI